MKECTGTVATKVSIRLDDIVSFTWVCDILEKLTKLRVYGLSLNVLGCSNNKEDGATWLYCIHGRDLETSAFYDFTIFYYSDVLDHGLLA